MFLKIPFQLYLLVGTIAFMTACSGDGGADGNSRQANNNKFPVRVVIADPSPISTTYSATGTFEPNEQVNLSAERSGRIERMPFEEGTAVGKNAIIAYINNDETRSRIQTLNVQLENAKANLERAKRLKSIDAVSQEELDNLRYEVDNISAQISELEVIKAKSVIKAPFPGRVGFRQVSPGAYVNPGDKIVELVAFHPLKATFSIPEKYVHNVSEGDTITITVNGMEPSRSPIDRISARIDAATRSFTARAIVDNQENSIMPGSFAKIDVPVYHNPDALLVPAEAIIQKLGGEELFLVKNGQAQATQVKIGARNQNFVEVTEGIAKGDSVIITGLLSLSNGVAVSPTVADLKIDTE